MELEGVGIHLDFAGAGVDTLPLSSETQEVVVHDFIPIHRGPAEDLAVGAEVLLMNLPGPIFLLIQSRRISWERERTSAAGKAVIPSPRE